eukprot:scaffold398_cov177-Ochromonas_danica.AAC.10
MTSNWKTILDECGQSHVYEVTHCLEDPNHPILHQLSKLDVRESLQHFHSAHEVESKHSLPFQPISEDKVVKRSHYDTTTWQTILHLGYEAIYEGKVAAIIMSGGQGTRLGYDGPKGKYNIEGKTIFPSQTNGVKLEMFIFDVFPLATRWLCMEVERGEEFAPVKNEPGNSADSPDTARELMSALAIRWLEQVGARVIPPQVDNEMRSSSHALAQCEISPLLSYEGEGLEHFANVEINLPVYLA